MHVQIVSYFYRHNHDSRDYLVTLITKFQKVLYNTFNTSTNTNFLWGVFKYFCESLHTVSRKYSVTLLFFEEQAEEFANHLYNAFTPHIINNSNFKSHTEEDPQTTTTTADKEYTIPKTSAQEIRNIIDKTKNNKAPGIDLINGKILKNLPPKAIRLITVIFNAILRIQYFPKPWKLAQIKMLHKPGKDPHQTASYRPISLLPIFSKILEK